MAKSNPSIKPNPRQALPLDAIRIERLITLAGQGRSEVEALGFGHSLALALDTIDRFNYRRLQTEKWPPKAGAIATALHGLAEILHSRWLEELDSDAQEFLKEAVSYLAILSELSAETDADRLKRYHVKIVNAARKLGALPDEEVA